MNTINTDSIKLHGQVHGRQQKVSSSDKLSFYEKYEPSEQQEFYDSLNIWKSLYLTFVRQDHFDPPNKWVKTWEASRADKIETGVSS